MMRLFAGALLALLPLLLSCTAAPAYQGSPSDHFDGSTFVNRKPMNKTPGDFIKLAWGAVTDPRTWPDWIEIETGQVAQARVNSGIVVTFINHATFLIQVDGVNILTDPVYSKRTSPVQWLGPKRVHAPGVALANLPPIDIVLISHNHYDHLDKDTLQQLFERQEQPPVILAGLGNGQLFQRLGLHSYHDMDWNDRFETHGLEVVFTECRHRSGRGIGDQMKTLWGSFVLKTSAGNIYFAGDTGYGPHLRQAGTEHGPFALSLLPIGAYDPRWFMADVHLNPEEAVKAHQDLRSRQSIAMHFGTFRLTYEGIEEPLTDLQLAIEKYALAPQRFLVLEPGQSKVIEDAEQRASSGQ